MLLLTHTEGLRRWGVAEVRDRFRVIGGRACRPVSNARWQVATVAALQDGGLTWSAALAEMLRLVLRAHAQQRTCAYSGTRSPREQVGSHD